MVGYPGETDNDFKETITLIKRVNFINSYSFIYSPRPGTPASNLETLEANILKNRLKVLQDTLEKIQINKNKSEIGKVLEVLVENKMKNQNKFFGRSEDSTPVIFTKGVESDVGKVVSIVIRDCNRNSLFGEKSSVASGVAA